MQDTTHNKKSESGSVLIMIAVLIFTLLGFSALGMEGGRWFLVRAELSKSVDAGALAAARNIANPWATPQSIALAYANANFPAGFLGTPGSGSGSAAFTTTVDNATNKVTVTGNVSAMAILARIWGFNAIPVSSQGTAQRRDVEIVLVLDRSGSMSGTPMTDLKQAASIFIDQFAATQGTDKMALYSFATSVKMERAMGINYVTPMKTAINSSNFKADGYTNTEDAIDQTDGPQGFTDQSGTPGDKRIQQFMILFSDGWPTAFRNNFKTKGVTYDACVHLDGDCSNGTPGLGNDLWKPTGNEADRWGIDPRTTGPGVSVGNTACQGRSTPTVRWMIFDTYAVPGYTATATCIPQANLCAQVCNLVTGLCTLKAQELKNKRITIYTIGLGTDQNKALMKSIASSPDLYYDSPSSDQLKSIFQRVAQDIKLRLVL
jgi:Flp pilus assembly protein TadG